LSRDAQPVAMTVQCKKFPRQHLINRHDQIVAAVAGEFRQLGFDCIKSGYEAGGQPYDPDLFVCDPVGGLGFYIEIKCPSGPNVAIDLEAWLWYRTLGDVFIVAVRGDGRIAVLDVGADRPLFWGAAQDDSIPVLAAEQLRVLDVPLRLFDRGDPSYTSNKPFVVFRPRRVYQALDQALSAVLRKAGGCCDQP
jgi:hypothetical protein